MAHFVKQYFYAVIIGCCLASMGCSTYLGYHIESSASCASSAVSESGDTADDASTQGIMVEKYRSYQPGAKAVEYFMWVVFNLMGPIFLIAPFPMDDPGMRFVFPPADLVAKLLGYPGIANALGEGYDENPPSYVVRLSQNTLTGMLNPFQCVMIPDDPQGMIYRKKNSIQTLPP